MDGWMENGSALGNIHHHDPWAPALPVGAVVQQGGVCSLEWSLGDEWLASGSPDGLLHVWDDIMGLAGSHQPVATMQQPSAVKAMGWCPWQRKMIATGGGWKDGKLRIWDTESATCVTSADSNSQICCLRWTDATRRLFTGHGRPHHSAICWEWDLSSLRPRRHLAVPYLQCVPAGLSLLASVCSPGPQSQGLQAPSFPSVFFSIITLEL
ncbi:cell division cycle protein 20 homolog B-like isoform X1 [Nerophis lumbriciformis]|uniref:cell division cycle protein 20 homolog B-like isoform X1 n=1 Tax=Nerophis lumbriciformis TaxID=546530 RepID=UPI003BAB040D